MRSRGDRANPKRPRRAIVGRVYEKFKPIYEWSQEDDHHSLLVYLPGFRKEFIKVITEDPNIIRVRGECLVSGNKWNQFQEDFKVPDTCKMSGTRAKFDGGILTIAMPKRIFDPPPTTTTATKLSSLTSATILPSQPPTTNPVGVKSNDGGVTDQKPLDQAEEKEPSIEKITNTTTGSDLYKNNNFTWYKTVVKGLAMGHLEKGIIKVVIMGAAVAVMVAFSVYAFYTIGFSNNEN